MTDTLALPVETTPNGHVPGLSADTARLLSTTTKTTPQMQVSSRWLLKKLPWVDIAGGTHRRNETVRDDEGHETAVDIVAGRVGTQQVPTTFVDYNTDPPELGLHAAQTILRVPIKVAHLYNGHINQVEQQIRLVIQAMRERQEHEMVNNTEIGVLHVVAPRHRLSADDSDNMLDALDELLGRRRDPHLFLAHPKAIVALGQECTRRGLTVPIVEVDGHRVPAWRGVPIYPCNKIPIDNDRTSVVLLRTGVEDQGVIGLHQTGLPDEWEPSLNVQFMGIDRGPDPALHYLISAYYSLDVLVPDALGVLDDIPCPSRAGERA